MAKNDDPHASYKLDEGDVLIGTYATGAKARRRQQRLESQADPQSQRQFTIKDILAAIMHHAAPFWT
jgi:hypothetical protein